MWDTKSGQLPNNSIFIIQPLMVSKKGGTYGKVRVYFEHVKLFYLIVSINIKLYLEND